MDTNIENTGPIVESDNDCIKNTGSENAGVSALAAAKIAKEMENFKGGHREKVVSKFVASTLTHFCEESERFAKAVLNTSRTLSDICAEVMAENPGDVSDIDVYRGAAKSYFPNAEVVFRMELSITGEDPSDEELSREPNARVRQTRSPRVPKTKPEEEKPVAKVSTKSTAAPSTPAVKKQNASKKEPKVETLQLTLF